MRAFVWVHFILGLLACFNELRETEYRTLKKNLIGIGWAGGLTSWAAYLLNQ